MKTQEKFFILLITFLLVAAIVNAQDSTTVVDTIVITLKELPTFDKRCTEPLTVDEYNNTATQCPNPSKKDEEYCTDHSGYN